MSCWDYSVNNADFTFTELKLDSCVSGVIYAFVKYSLNVSLLLRLKRSATFLPLHQHLGGQRGSKESFSASGETKLVDFDPDAACKVHLHRSVKGQGCRICDECSKILSSLHLLSPSFSWNHDIPPSLYLSAVVEQRVNAPRGSRKL